MAVNRAEQTAKLIVKVENGVNASGNPVYAQRSFADLNTALTDDDVLSIGSMLGELQEHGVEAISRQESAVLAAE